MYPFKDDHVFLRDSWYVVAFPDELNTGPIERTVMGERIAIFRMSDGTVSAMAGICPHRFYPLAQGKVIGDALQCNYHGFQFDGRTGACVKIPSQAATPKTFRQRIYPIVEHGPWIWLWPGNPVLADKSLLPPLNEIGVGAGWRVDHTGLLHVEARAQLLVDNLQDLTHVAFLHAVSVDGSSLVGNDVTYRDEGRVVRSMRRGRSEWVDGFYDLLFKPENRFEGLHHSDTGCWFFSPGYMTTFSGFITDIDSKASVDPAIYGNYYFHHILTPETAHSTHYFSTTSRNYRLDDDELSRTMVGLDRTVRMQDVVAVGLVERNLSSLPTKPSELLCRADSAAAYIRRRMQAALDAEAANNHEPAARAATSPQAASAES